MNRIAGLPSKSAITVTVGVTLLVGWLVGQCVRDQYWLTALAFYVPSPLLAATFLASAAWACWHRRARLCVLWIMLALLPSYFVIALENRWHRAISPAASGNVVRVVHWNVGHGARGWPSIRDRLLGLDADLYLISEMPPTLSPAVLRREFGRSSNILAFGNMAVIAQSALGEVASFENSAGSRTYSFVWHSEQGPVKVFFSDFASLAPNGFWGVWC